MKLNRWTFLPSSRSLPGRRTGWWRRFAAAGLALGLVFLLQPAHAGTPGLVGEWLSGAANLTDQSGYSPTGTHDGYDAAGTGAYLFTNDVPPYRTGVALSLPAGTTAIAINNSSSLDWNYTNTFDGQLASALTVSFWAKGFPGGWFYFISKNGESGSPEAGWTLHRQGSLSSPCWTMRNPGGTITVGAPVSPLPVNGRDYVSTPDDLCPATNLNISNNQWIFYTGTYNQVTGVRNFYVNGVLVAQTTNCGVYNLAPSSHVVIGGYEASPGGVINNFFTGEFFDVRLSNYELSSNQVLAAYGPPPGTPAQFTGAITPTVASDAGATAQLSVPDGGSAPLTNQWRFNGVALTDGAYGGATITGSSSKVLTIANVTTNNQGVYAFTVGNAFGSATTNIYLGVLAEPPASNANLVGRWLPGTNTLADVSGYLPAGTHDGYWQRGGTHHWTNDVPTYYGGPEPLYFFVSAGSQSLYLNNDCLVISNTSTWDANYTNTFDDLLTNAFTLTFWAKGFPTGWNYFISKNGDSGSPDTGWTLRRDGGFSGNNPDWTMRSPGGTFTLGTPYYGVTDDLGTSTMNLNDGYWHFYVGTYNQGTGYRNLYVGGVLVAQATNCGAYNLAAAEHLVIGGIDDSPGNSFNLSANFTGLFYDVRLYDAELSPSQFPWPVPPYPGPLPVPPTLSKSYTPGINGAPGSFVLTWNAGTLLETTNFVTGPWTTITNSSPYTNTISTTNRQIFFRVSNP